MLTKIGVAALLGTIGTAAVGGTASAQEFRRPEPVRVTVAAPAPLPVAYGYGTPGVYYRHDRRDDFRRLERERREAAMRHAEWLRHHGGWGYGRR
jgi:hypothetical protein